MGTAEWKANQTRRWCVWHACPWPAYRGSGGGIEWPPCLNAVCFSSPADRFKGLKPTIILLSRGISNAESSWRAGQGWQRKGRLRSVVWARTKPPPPEYVDRGGAASFSMAQVFRLLSGHGQSQTGSLFPPSWLSFMIHLDDAVGH